MPVGLYALKYHRWMFLNIERIKIKNKIQNFKKLGSGPVFQARVGTITNCIFLCGLR